LQFTIISLYVFSQIACKNANVSINPLSAKFDGIFFEPSEAKVFSMNSFSIKGRCSQKVLRIYFKINDSSDWTQVDGTNGTVDCPAKGEFTINFSESSTKITESSGYIRGTGTEYPKINVLVYGQAENYDTLEKTFTALIDSSNKHSNAISSSSIHEISGSGFKIKGQIINGDYGSSLSNGTHKIQAATKNLIQ
jgi:hypothetical protein